MENNCETTPRTKTLREHLSTWRFWKPVVAVVTGSILGFLNYYYIGCSSGSCAITSNPYSSIIVGGMLGLFVVNSPCSRGRC